MSDAGPPALTAVERLPELAAIVGTDVGVSDWKLIDQATIDGFAALTGDDGPIHTNPEVAAQIAPFGGTIVQGFMMLSHLTGFAKSLRLPDRGVAFRLNYGFDRVRIITPVPVDSRIRGRFSIGGLENRGPNAALLTLHATVELEGVDTPAVVADWLAYLQLDEAGS
jgi:acyl dehydratase